jgi:hypothetical protein
MSGYKESAEQRGSFSGWFNYRLNTGGKLVGKDKFDEAMKAVEWLSRQDVLVGIPADNNEREDFDGGTSHATNAVIGYAHEFGVPEHNLPARPFLGPGVDNTEEDWLKSLDNAARKAFDGDQDAAHTSLMRAGDKAVRGVQAVIRAQAFQPLADSTIEARTARMWKSYPARLRKFNKMSKADQITFMAGAFKILQDTNQMFRSITYVIRER